ncbi:MAG: RNA methyltransferase [Deltaproteobacteria bacterium]
MKPSRPHEPRPPREDPSDVVYGLRAALAAFATRREDILRVAFSPDTRAAAAELARWAEGRGLPCREMRDDELARVADSDHHEGLCVVTRPRRWVSPSDLAEALLRRRGAAIALDRVRNPYNIGAILRSAAFFGLDAALLGAPAPHPALAPGAVRVAEGGVEHLMLTRTTDLVDTLGRLRARGVQIVGAESDGSVNAVGFAFARPAVLVLGNEREGLSPRVRAVCDALVAIPGAKTVDSLNVSIAASVLMAEMVRDALTKRRT